jgi:hypothetical protein
MHSSDHGVSAEHHYFSTAHGKGPCDGIGAIVKRASKNSSIQGKIISIRGDLEIFAIQISKT